MSHANRPAGPWKRSIDLLVGSLALLACSPVMLGAAIAVKFDSKGPVLYRQRRVGLGGCPFDMFKFRSMVVDCDQHRHHAAAANWFQGATISGTYKPADDPRITRVGRWLRRSSLDELPQLFNVLHGDMSLVGPRPSMPYELRYYRADDFQRLTVKPGMTGLWQVSGRETLSALEMMKLDMEYARRCSLPLDLRILLATAPVVLLPLLGNLRQLGRKHA